jgi:hypothetical protein
MLYIYVEGNYVWGGETMEQEKKHPPHHHTHQLNSNEGIGLSNTCSYIQANEKGYDNKGI